MNRLILLIIIAFAVALAFLGCKGSKEDAKAGGEQNITGALRVDIFPAKIGDVRQTIRYSGIIKGYREVPVTPGMSSWVTKILVKEGDRVSAGQLLARLSPEQLQQAEAQYRATEDNYNRMKKLLDQNSISKQQFDQIEAGYKAAKAMFDLAAKNTELRAPFSGIVASVNAEEGEFFNAMMAMGSSPSVVTVVDQRNIKMEPGVSGRDVVKIKQGQKAYLKTDTYPDTMFWGKVERVEQMADQMSGTYKVSIVFPNEQNKLRSGMYATVFIILAQADSVLLIPQKAIVNDTIVFIADGNRARAKRITVGVQSDSLAQVLDGVKENDPIIIGAILGLFDGAPIVIKQ